MTAATVNGACQATCPAGLLLALLTDQPDFWFYIVIASPECRVGSNVWAETGSPIEKDVLACVACDVPDGEINLPAGKSYGRQPITCSTFKEHGATPIKYAYCSSNRGHLRGEMC